MKAFRKGARRPAWVSTGLAIFLGLGTGFTGWEARGQATASQEQAMREELETARREIERLKAENARLKGQTVAPTTPTVPADPGSGTTTLPVAPNVAEAAAASAATVVVPAPIPEGESVTATQLLADYRTSSMAGDARYKGRRIRVEGTVQSFKKSFLGLTWDVHLKGGDALGLIRCRTSFPGISDFRGEGTLILEGRRPFKAWQMLLSKGGKVVLEGLCEGANGPVVAFKDCRPAQNE